MRKLVVAALAVCTLIVPATALANHSDACGNDGPNGGDDLIVGTEGNDCIRGGNGNDTVLGLGGNDRLGGNHGKDVVRGGEGDDRIFGGRGPDTLEGGPGFDVCGVDANDKVSGCEKLVDPGRD
jgi:Ca2+-binding RTX toxin-like protein